MGRPLFRNHRFGRVNEFIANCHSWFMLAKTNDSEHSYSSFRRTKHVRVGSVMPQHQQSSWGMRARRQSRVAEEFLLRGFLPTFPFDGNDGHVISNASRAVWPESAGNVEALGANPTH